YEEFDPKVGNTRIRGIGVTTDENGHYRLFGLRRAPAYLLSVEPGRDLPYFSQNVRVPVDTPAPQPTSFDIELKRAIVVRGRVTEKRSGRPVPAEVEVYTFKDNSSNIREFPGAHPRWVLAPRREDGRFEVLAIPGRSIVAARAGGQYRR